ncbi:MFS transporter [Brevibacillus brevis]|uniref:MFS transporter n=1 Tax=Brevibacillus brevis TaxID=1393 RepID=UPI000D10FD6A|nr:MFS transporter [Brevibacillus brevis]PSJ68776.1 MFS transporter [Brevibacillus brevis]RED29324.1 DHA1 family putative efflux transporter-like MFS transporter [Brevibacillus brevis]GEC91502.1 putative MFS-type transporter YbcL [Brevibacillus brevis]VEF87925.1 Purine efflux pump PbuE [Brevibacillus brevis]
MGNKWVVYILALAVFLIGTVEYLISGIIQMVAADLGVTTSSAGLLVTAFALSAAVGAPIVIAATIHLDRKKLLLMMLGIFILSNWLVYVSPSFEMMLVTRMIQGLSGGVATVVAMAVSTRLVEEGNRGRAIGIILMGLSSSLVLGLPVGTFLSEAIGWRLLFIFIGLLSLVPLFVIYKKVRPIKAQEAVTPRAQLAVIKNKKILAAVVITLLYIGAYSTLFTYIAPFLLTQAELSASEISGILFLAGICSFMGSKIGGVIADRKGPKFTIYVGLSLQASMLLLLSVMDGVITAHIVIIMLWMLATWATSPAQQLYLVTQVPRSPDIALSINTSFIQFGFALGSWVGGLVISNSSVEHLGWYGFVIALLSLLLAIRLFTLKKEQLSA